MKQADANTTFFHPSLLKQTLGFLMIGCILFFSGCQKLAEVKFPGKGEGGHTPPSLNKATVATDWYKLQLRMILQASPAKSNLATIRLFAYSGISLFEASRFEMYGSKSLQGQLNQMPSMPLPQNGKKYSWVVAANAALANITRDIFAAPNAANLASIDSLEKIYTDKYTAAEGTDVVARSAAFGDSVASTIFNWAKSDLFNHANDPYTPPVFSGAWIPTPPAFAAAAGPHFGDCRTFYE